MMTITKTRNGLPVRLGPVALLVALSLAMDSRDALEEEPAKGGPSSTEQAEALFNRAMELLGESNTQSVARACPMLEESLRLDPAMGTRYRLAECYEKTNHPALAYKHYLTVAEEARRAGMLDRAKRAQERSDALFAMLARLVVWVPPEVADIKELRVMLDGAELDRSSWGGDPRIVDPGEHVLEATAPGHKPYRRVVPVGLTGEPIELSIPAMHDVNEPPPPPRTTFVAPKPSEQRTPASTAALVLGLGGTGAIVAGAGIAGVAIATGGLSESTRWSAGTGIALGSVGVVAGGITWLAAKQSSGGKTDATFVLVPRLGLTEGGLSLVGRF